MNGLMPRPRPNLALAYNTMRMARRRGRFAEGGKVGHYEGKASETEQDKVSGAVETDPAETRHPKGHLFGGYSHADSVSNMAKGGYSERAQSFIGRRMHTFGRGKMHSSTKEGPVVTEPKQAVAIAMSEARKKGMKVPKAMAEGGMVPKEDEAREHDEIRHEQPESNMSLHPGFKAHEDYPERHLGMKAQEHEDLPHPAEWTKEELPESENLPAHMLAMGGMIHPKRIASMIRMGRVGTPKMGPRYYAEGGAVPPTSEDMDWRDRPEGGDSIDNFHAETHTDNDWLSGEEQSPYFHPNQADLYEENTKARRKGTLSNIMRGLHAKHLGK